MRKKQFETLPPEHEGEKAGGEEEYAAGAFIRDGILAVDFYENRSGRWSALWRTLLGGREFCNYDFGKRIWSGEKLDTAGSRHMKMNIFRNASGRGCRLLGDAEKTVSDFVRQKGGLICPDIWNTMQYEEDRIAEERRETAVYNHAKAAGLIPDRDMGLPDVLIMAETRTPRISRMVCGGKRYFDVTEIYIPW